MRWGGAAALGRFDAAGAAGLTLAVVADTQYLLSGRAEQVGARRVLGARGGAAHR
jgi:hypothetical protein